MKVRIEVIAAAATRAFRDGENEDRVLVIGNGDGYPGAAVVLCDGVGSTADAAAAAERFSRLAAESLMAGGDRRDVWALTTPLTAALPVDDDGETTLIALAAQETGEVSYILIGNGGVIELAPSPLPGGGVRLLWSDVVLPHVDWSEGRPALDATLPAGAGLRVARGAQFVAGEARAYAVFSDGIATLEEREEGEAPDGSVWREVPVGLAQLVSRLTAIWPDLLTAPREVAEAALAEGMETLLSELSVEPGLEDDSSVGIVVLRPTPAAPGAGDAVERR